MIENERGGKTMYIGSRESEKFSRIYDKRDKSGGVDEWWRYEIEIKGDTAKEISRTIVQPGVDLGSLFDAVAFNMLNVPELTYQAFRGANLPISAPKIERVSDRERWIASQVECAVIEHIVKSGITPAVRSLFDKMKIYIEEIERYELIKN
jgi:hypothetical protein